MQVMRRGRRLCELECGLKVLRRLVLSWWFDTNTTLFFQIWAPKSFSIRFSVVISIENFKISKIAFRSFLLAENFLQNLRRRRKLYTSFYSKLPIVFSLYLVTKCLFKSYQTIRWRMYVLLRCRSVCASIFYVERNVRSV